MGWLMKEHHTLLQRRSDIETQWESFVSGDSVDDDVRFEIAASWKRSATHLTANKSFAPTEDSQVIEKRWQKSALAVAAAKQQDNIKQLAKEGELVAAIADPCGTLLWTYASKHMVSRAENVHFHQGGRWDEPSAGTNAVGLSLRLKQAVTVFSSEHYQPFVHDWVCYAAPIIHPESGQCVGILDLSTTWKRHTPLGQAAVNDMARSIAAALPLEQPKAALEIHVLGRPRIVFKGKKINLTNRQLEILCILALHPQGLHLDAFHAALYGDACVSSTTLKAEISHLRQILDGQIASRPYQLTMPFWADFVEIWHFLKQHDTHEAMALYRAPMLLTSQSPSIEEWRTCLDATMQQCIHHCDDASLLMEHMHQAGEHLAVQERLTEIAALKEA